MDLLYIQIIWQQECFTFSHCSFVFILQSKIQLFIFKECFHCVFVFILHCGSLFEMIIYQTTTHAHNTLC